MTNDCTETFAVTCGGGGSNCGGVNSSAARNLLINVRRQINQREYVSGAATIVVNQDTVDR